MQRMTIDFGIDLGTTNSTVAVIDGTDAKPIPNSAGSVITPSAVWIDKRGNLHVGAEAKEWALVSDPDNGDLEFKLRMGLGPAGKKIFTRSKREMLPEELSAEVLKSLKADVQTNMGEELTAVVITVPAAFELPQTDATQKAAKLAGFVRSPLLLEPVAASLAYGFQTTSENVYWLVYDFGGGTFDAAVMRVREGLIQVVNHDGDNHLGGKLLDWDLVTRKLIPALQAQFNLPDFRRGNPAWRDPIGKLKWYAERAKIEVCRTQKPQEIFVEELCQDADGKNVDFSYQLTPDDVKDVSKPYIERSLGLCRKTLKEKGLAGGNLERILMVGGSTLNPWLREAVAAELGAKLEFGIDPVTVVARGAAIFASTQPMPREGAAAAALPKGTWRIEVEHEPVGNVTDPEIGGRVIAPDGRSLAGHTVEFVDTKTQVRSGRVNLREDGVFMTQLFAEEKRRCEFAIELCDAAGTRIPTSPDRVVYTLGVIPDKPPVSATIGIGLPPDQMCPYVRKGARLPARGMRDHQTHVSLRAGKNEDFLRIALIEGENARASRNHFIGELKITGADIRRDLPAGSVIEVTVTINESQDVTMQAFIPSLDEDFQVSFSLISELESLEHLRRQADEQKQRLTKAQGEAGKAAGLKAQAALARIADEQLLSQVDALAEAATQDPDALAQLDRRLRDLASAIDDVEDSVQWPKRLEEAEISRKDAENLIGQHGDTSDKNHLRALTDKLRGAIDAGDPDVLRQCTEELDMLWFQVADRLLAYHVGRFNRLAAKASSMRDPAQAETLITQGRRAINNEDREALKSANRQLAALLPREEAAQLDRRISDGIH